MNQRFVALFSHIDDWVFDLDNCLYPASTGLFELIDERMGAFIQRLLGCRFDPKPSGSKKRISTNMGPRWRV